MNDTPIDLDAHRAEVDQKAATRRREQLELIEKVHTAQALRDEDIEQALLDTPAHSWSDIAPKVRFLLEAFSAMPGAGQGSRKKLISQVLNELKRLEHQTRKSDGRPDDAP